MPRISIPWYNLTFTNKGSRVWANHFSKDEQVGGRGFPFQIFSGRQLAFGALAVLRVCVDGIHSKKLLKHASSVSTLLLPAHSFIACDYPSLLFIAGHV